MTYKEVIVDAINQWNLISHYSGKPQFEFSELKEELLDNGTVHRVSIVQSGLTILKEEYDEKLNLFAGALKGAEALNAIYYNCYLRLLSFGISDLIRIANKIKLS